MILDPVTDFILEPASLFNSVTGSVVRAVRERVDRAHVSDHVLTVLEQELWFMVNARVMRISTPIVSKKVP